MFNINNNFLNSRDTQCSRNAGQEIYAGRPRVGNDKRGMGFPRRRDISCKVLEKEMEQETKSVNMTVNYGIMLFSSMLKQ